MVLAVYMYKDFFKDVHSVLMVLVEDLKVLWLQFQTMYRFVMTGDG